jgi:beta-glucosidase
VFVNFSGSAMGFVPETASCDAILQAWYPGQAGGTAIANVLFGDYNPSGKLPVTFYKNIQQLPDFENYNMKGRTYRYMTEKPLFPFGHGLSYTTFAVGNALFSKKAIKRTESLELTIPVSNTGTHSGSEILQIYVRKLNDIDGPIKTLRSFKKVEVSAGKTAKAIIQLAPTAFEFFDWTQRKMLVTPGEYEVYYGNSSDANHLKAARITIK